MKKIELLKRLEKYPLFEFNEFVRMTGKKPEYARTYLYRLKRDGLVFQIEKGKYTVHDDPMVFSSYIVIPSYISFWTALKFYGFTEQLPVEIMVASPRQKKSLVFLDTRISFFKTKHMWGYKKQKYMDFDIFVGEKEKCIIDSLIMKNVPFDEIAKAIGTKNFNREKIIAHAVRTKNKATIKRLGYLMGKFGLPAEELAGHIDNNYILLDWRRKRKGKREKKWKIIVNRGLDDIY